DGIRDFHVTGVQTCALPICYNSSLSNSPFDIKKRQLAASGLLMNHEIAGYPRWGRPEIAERSNALAERIIEAWPGPTDAERTVRSEERRVGKEGRVARTSAT